ncbi:aminotransferase class V-fold PLP-dependent enzyme [Rhizobium sp. EC-SD404]|uniref:aminotransferase class V-fold PLP-dependent enzyme n=1 Tax=Rhizobium sp. EC-SD404 TaxID=2038389 RepID=UPI001253EA49|nr:aminotransferase class V-fold PLP-dependent enzyme [Rhizobium sp. EC-SD404]VVT08850.1 Cysteine desulfurase [Rhizobium sp. EC-SD404]
MDGILETWARTLGEAGDLIGRLREGLIGEGALIDGPHGPRRLVYADYTASGRALRQIEMFVMEQVLPFYANSHTEASHCGAYSTRLREAARASIARTLEAGSAHSVIFTGSGATAAINRLVGLLAIPERIARGEAVTVIIGPYEHHSNLLPWRESGAQIVEIAEQHGGGPDKADLEAALVDATSRGFTVAAFSAASNVTGIVSDVVGVTRLVKAHGAIAIWDYAAGAPYLPMSMVPADDAAIDAIVFSPHKFIGGPGASGILALKNDIVATARPTLPGGGTVSFVSPWAHRYSDRIIAREEAGTPNGIGDIRAALVLLVKEAVGQSFITRRNRELREMALKRWLNNPRLDVLGRQTAEALPVVSLRVRDGRGGHVHHQLVTRMLSDHHGIQARGGCACAGPYAHRLLGIDEAASRDLAAAIDAGMEMEKPGWVRLNFSYLLSDEKARLIIDAVDELASKAADLAADYRSDPATARFVAGRESSVAA